MHATFQISPGGEIKLMDQFSRTGTAVKRGGLGEEEKVTESAVTLGHGDCVRFGSRNFTICMVPRQLIQAEGSAA